jgi:hypothetical protein
MRSLAVCLLCLSVAPLARAEPPSARVLAWVGPRLPGSPRVGERLADGAALSVPAGTTLQLLLQAPGPSARSASHDAVLSLLGPARGRLLSAGSGELYEVEAARLSGPAWFRFPGRLRVSPGEHGSVIFARGQLHVRSGEVSLSSPGAPTVVLRGPRSARIGLDGELLEAFETLAPATERRLARFGAPPVWLHALGPVGAAEVGRAVEVVRAEQQAARQAASCGCTESRGGTVGQLPGSGTGLSPIERSGTTLRVRITGIPRSVP